MPENNITINEALITLQRAAGGAYCSIDSATSIWSGEIEHHWMAWRGDIHESYKAATMEEALAKALKGVR